MTTCANCESPAELVYEITPSLSINYCVKHLPRSVKANYAGAVKSFVETPAKATKKKVEVVVEDAPIEESSVEEDGLS
jgi:hypothetical protein